MNMFRSGMLRNHPLMQQFNQLTSGQTSYEQKKEAIIKFGMEKGYKREDMEAFLNSHP